MQLELQNFCSGRNSILDGGSLLSLGFGRLPFPARQKVAKSQNLAAMPTVQEKPLCNCDRPLRLEKQRPS